MIWLRGGVNPAAPLERLARQSPDFTMALADGRPTLVEFYADWCEACRAMAPAMEAIESRRRNELDVVLLNVDNPRWQPQLDLYDVNGIPQLELFNADGRAVGRSLGARSAGGTGSADHSPGGGQPPAPAQWSRGRQFPGRISRQPPRLSKPALAVTAERLLPFPFTTTPRQPPWIPASGSP